MTSPLPSKVKRSSLLQGERTRNAFRVMRPSFWLFWSETTCHWKLDWLATGNPITKRVLVQLPPLKIFTHDASLASHSNLFFSPWSESISTKQKRWGQASENTLSLSVHLLMIPTRQSACTKSLYELKRTLFSNVALGIILLFNPLQIFTILFYLDSPILGRVTTTARGASRRALNSSSTHER